MSLFKHLMLIHVFIKENNSIHLTDMNIYLTIFCSDCFFLFLLMYFEPVLIKINSANKMLHFLFCVTDGSI